MKQETPLQKLKQQCQDEIRNWHKAKFVQESERKYKQRSIEMLEMFISMIDCNLPYEREVIENYGEKMQIVEDVDPYGNVTFVFDPKTHFDQTFKSE